MNCNTLLYRLAVGMFFSILCITSVMAQETSSLENILSEIASNNLSLKALREKTDAATQNTAASASLPNPEIEFAYLFGAGENNPHRKDISITQSFDFATLSGSRKAAALKGANLLELEYRAVQRDILTEARKLIYEIVYYNALIREFDVRLEHASDIERAYSSGLEKGEFNIMDYRKASLNLTETENRLQILKAEKETLLAKLKALNGGIPINISFSSQNVPFLPQSFEEWLEEASESSSTLAYVRENTALEEENLRLTKNEALPSFSIGYMAELIPGEEFRGVSVGVSIPLWSSGKKVKGAKSSLNAAKFSEQEALSNFRTEAESIFMKAKSLSEATDKYKALSDTEQVCSDLDKALKVGSISLLEYITELSFYYDAKEKALETERDHAIAVAALLSLAM